jgi:TldD protein
MGEVAFSPFLAERRPYLETLVEALERRYGYASILASDSQGFIAAVNPTVKRLEDNPWSERGCVVRVQRAGRIAERAFNELPGDADPAWLEAICADLDRDLAAGGAERRTYPPLPDEPLRSSFRGEVARDPFAVAPEAVLAPLADLAARIMAADKRIVFARASAEFMAVSKLFISPRRRLDQAFLWGASYLSAVARAGGTTRDYYERASGQKGLELLDELPAKVPVLAADLLSLLDAGQPEPGEYEVICSPDIAGLIAHEAFGHGMELDMFVKKRARAMSYMGKAIASPLVTMYEGAAGVAETGSYAFDDEGRTSTRTTVIDRGILKAGISDLLSAASLGTPPTGNGRRQNFAHKAYARMTNTYFAAGGSKVADMIASVKRGYLLDRFSSGMEDPRNWGIQLVCMMGREIVDGKLTGKVVSPVVGSGYVPDVLAAVSMVSDDFELNGCGMCGKGHKEFVKTAAGGPYLKTRMRLG